MWLLLQTTFPTRDTAKKQRTEECLGADPFPTLEKGNTAALAQVGDVAECGTRSHCSTSQLLQHEHVKLSRWCQQMYPLSRRGTNPLQLRAFIWLSAQGAGWLLGEHQPQLGSTQGGRITYLLHLDMKMDLRQQQPDPFVSTAALAAAEIQHLSSRLPWLWSNELPWDTQRLKCKQSSRVVADKSLNSKPALQICDGDTSYLFFPSAWPTWQYFPVDLPVIIDFSTRQNYFQSMQTWEKGKKSQ